MWTTCPVVLDEPVLILGFEVEDFGIVLMLPLLLSPLFDAGWCFAAGALVGAGARRFKRGRPQGALLHWLHGLQLVRLPGVLPPTGQDYSPW